MRQITKMAVMMATLFAIVHLQSTPARSQTPAPATLDAVTMEGVPTAVADCHFGADSTIGFTVSGTTGTVNPNGNPYAGTYSESGATTMDDGLNSKPVKAFEATFIIVSGDTTITGTKRLFTGSQVLATNQGHCSDPSPRGFGVAATYEALIVTPDGIFSDRGLALVALNAPNSAGQVHFFERFYSDLVVAEPAVSSPGKVTGGGQFWNGSGKVSFGLEAKNSATGLRGHCTVIDNDSVPKVTINCVDVTTLLVQETHVIVFGNAEINGVGTTYRIDINDLGDSGIGADTFQIQTGSGYSTGGTLAAGNVKVHK
jgi:hypothetical protein